MAILMQEYCDGISVYRNDKKKAIGVDISIIDRISGMSFKEFK